MTLFFPHKPIPAPNHSFYVPISDLPSKGIHHIRHCRPAMLRVRFPDRFVDLLFTKNPGWVVDDIVYILRGYEDFDGKLRGLGAEIERVNNAKDIRKFRLRA